MYNCFSICKKKAYWRKFTITCNNLKCLPQGIKQSDFICFASCICYYDYYLTKCSGLHTTMCTLLTVNLINIAISCKIYFCKGIRTFKISNTPNRWASSHVHTMSISMWRYFILPLEVNTELFTPPNSSDCWITL